MKKLTSFIFKSREVYEERSKNNRAAATTEKYDPTPPLQAIKSKTTKSQPNDLQSKRRPSLSNELSSEKKECSQTNELLGVSKPEILTNELVTVSKSKSVTKVLSKEQKSKSPSNELSTVKNSKRQLNKLSAVKKPRSQLDVITSKEKPKSQLHEQIKEKKAKNLTNELHVSMKKRPKSVTNEILTWKLLNSRTNETSMERKLTFVCISDTHCKLKDDFVKCLPHGDVLLHTGDFTMDGTERELIEFNKFLGTLSHTYKVVIAGNHEFCLEDDRSGDRRYMTQYYKEKYGVNRIRDLLSNCIYLQDELTEICGIKIYGSPCTPMYSCCDAFSLPDKGALQQKWEKIPAGVDILMTHGPPRGFGDTTSNQCSAGCSSLLKTVQDRVKPKYHVFGHIHEGYGVYTDGRTTYINASTCTRGYKPTNKPVKFRIKVENIDCHDNSYKCNTDSCKYVADDSICDSSEVVKCFNDCDTPDFVNYSNDCDSTEFVNYSNYCDSTEFVNYSNYCDSTEFVNYSNYCDSTEFVNYSNGCDTSKYGKCCDCDTSKFGKYCNYCDTKHYHGKIDSTLSYFTGQENLESELRDCESS